MTDKDTKEKEEVDEETDDEKEEDDTTEEEETGKEEVKEDLKGQAVTTEHLKELRDHYDAKLAELAQDKTKDAEEKASLREQLNGLKETLDNMLQAEEEKEKTKGSSTTMVVPPDHLDPPQKNPETQEQEEHRTGKEPEGKKKFRFY